MTLPNGLAPPTPSDPAFRDAVADVLERVRARAPRVHAVTNAAAQVLTANLLLALGAVPSLTFAAEEIGAFVARADALLINLGTLDRERRAAIPIALEAAAAGGKPWVLDPVFCDRSPGRAELARALLDRAPAVVRGNAAEIAALANAAPDAAGYDRFAGAHRTVLAVTGPTDIVSDGARRVTLANGHPLMARSTAIGCAGTALIAACLAVEADPLRAAAAGLTILGVAGEIAAARARGPGSFVPELIDALYLLDRRALVAAAKLEGPIAVAP